MTEDIPYVNLKAQFESEEDELLERLKSVLHSGVYIGGEAVKNFEADVCRYLGVSNCVGLNSGTDAILLPLLAMEIGPGDEVLTQSNSYIASASAIALTGAKPVFVDVMEDQSIDISDLKQKINCRTRAIMPVHLTGRIGAMDELLHLASTNGIKVVEDAAQAIGSTYNERKSGTIGDVGCFSAHPLKNLNACGDAGFCVTEDPHLDKKIRLLANHGLTKRSWAEVWGTVSRLDPLQATILSHRIINLEKLIEKRRNLAALYYKHLSHERVKLPPWRRNCRDTFHTFVIMVEQRDKLVNFLASNGISTSIHYPIPIHLQPVGLNLGWKKGDLPETESQAEKILSLPINQTLTEEQVWKVANKVNQFVCNRKS